MNLIYNSDLYSIVEFDMNDDPEALQCGGYEIMSKFGRYEVFLRGERAETFRREVEDLIASEPTMEEVDAYLARYDPLMPQPTLFH